MTLVVPNAGEEIMLENIVNKTAPQNLVLKLYSNNIVPSETDTDATFTEVSGSGYVPKTLTGASWGTVTAGEPSSIAYAAQTFTFTGAAGNVYGYYMVQATSGDLVWAERFTAAPYNIANNGDTITITPTITLQ